MSMLTSEFADDLDSLRKVSYPHGEVDKQDKNFQEKRSLPILIRALEEGKNIFSPEERKLILEQS
jgi:hypothetical protein